MLSKTKIWLLIFYLISVCSHLHAQLPSAPNYLITHEKEVIVAEKIQYTDLKSVDLYFTVLMPDGTQQTLSGRGIWRFKITEGSDVTFYQVAAIETKRGTEYTPMRLHTSGRLTLLSQRRQSANWPFVTGKDFNNFITVTQNYGKLLKLLNECDAFREGYQKKKGKKLKRLKDMITFYNLYCGQEESEAFPHEFGMRDCIPLKLNESNFVINSQEEFESAVPNGTTRDVCMRESASIDWERYSLVGNNISSGNCSRPIGLDFNCHYAESSNTMMVNIVYEENQPLCRALSSYNYWLLIPRQNAETKILSSVNVIDQTDDR